jgi:hypothetical protein
MSRTQQAPPAHAGDDRIVEANDLADPDHDDAIDAPGERERRWYHLRPEPRRGTDLMGLNATWWMALAWATLLLGAIALTLP